MNRNLSLCAASLLFSLSFVSCAGTGGDGETVKYPTIDEMARHEQRWGMAPRQVKQRLRPLDPGESVPVQSNSAPASASAPAPAPAMLAPSPEPLTPAPSAPVDSSTLQKLR